MPANYIELKHEDQFLGCLDRDQNFSHPDRGIPTKMLTESAEHDDLEKALLDFQVRSYNQGTIEYLGLEGSTRIIKLQPPSHMQGH